MADEQTAHHEQIFYDRRLSMDLCSTFSSLTDCLTTRNGAFQIGSSGRPDPTKKDGRHDEPSDKGGGEHKEGKEGLSRLNLNNANGGSSLNSLATSRRTPAIAHH